MRFGDKKKAVVEVPDDIKVLLIPHRESVENFRQRTNEVHDMLVRMILIARKQGRPNLKEMPDEKAA